MRKINKDEFEELVLKSNKTVIVDFYADWCGPCKALSPIIEELASETNDGTEFYKLNIDNNTDLAMKYGIASIPAVLVFKDGKVANKSIGLVNKDVLKALI